MKMVEIPEELWQKVLENDLKQDRRIARLEKRLAVSGGDCHTLEECAFSIGVSIETVKSYIKSGRLKCEYPAAKKCIRREDLDRFRKGMGPK